MWALCRFRPFEVLNAWQELMFAHLEVKYKADPRPDGWAPVSQEEQPVGGPAEIQIEGEGEVEVECPLGIEAGENMEFTTPRTGRTLSVVVPAGVGPGDVFTVFTAPPGGDAGAADEELVATTG